jgi:hypothetical protein
LKTEEKLGFRQLSEERRKKIIDKIKKLLSLSDKGKNTNEYEAALAASKAQDLLLRYNLNLTDIEYKSEKCKQTFFDIGSKNPGKWASSLVVMVMRHFYCEVLYAGKGKYIIVGEELDAEVASFTFDYLHETVTRLAKDFAVKHKILRDARTMRTSYSIGAVTSIEETLVRLKKINESVARFDARIEHGEENALVILENKLENIKEHIQENFPNLKKKQNYISVNDQYAYEQGREDGRSIAIRQGLK